MLNVRQRIALWFVGLSAFVYITPTVLGIVFFYHSLTIALDHELRTLESSLGHAVDVRGTHPQFRDWARTVQTNPRRSLATIQLFDVRGNLLEHYGLPGIPKLLVGQKECSENGHHVRVVSTPLLSKGVTIGYLQIQASTKEREEATQHFALTMALIAPFVLIGLGICSYYVSDKATIPIRQTISMLRRFLADASHELNTPVSIISAANEALDRKLHKQGIEAQATKVIGSSAERMQKIITDLMLLAEIESPVKLPAEWSKIQLGELVEECVNELSFKFDQKKIEVDCLEIQPLFMYGDRQSIKIMINNLLENAYRYTEPGGKVLVALRQDSIGLRLSIADTGIGIPLASQPHIFDRFYRVDKSRSRDSGGCGLGLSIVKAIVDMHQGKIEVKSVVGEGAEFQVIFPEGLWTA